MAVDRRLSLIADGFYPGSERYQTLTDGWLDDRPQEPWFKPPIGSATWTTTAGAAAIWASLSSGGATWTTTSGGAATWASPSGGSATWTTTVPKTPLGNPRV